MPLYEYVCESDGTVLELIRPMADADKPVPDPEGKGRRFVRKMSTFAAKGEAGSIPRSTIAVRITSSVTWILLTKLNSLVFMASLLSGCPVLP